MPRPSLKKPLSDGQKKLRQQAYQTKFRQKQKRIKKLEGELDAVLLELNALPRCAACMAQHAALVASNPQALRLRDLCLHKRERKRLHKEGELIRGWLRDMGV